MDLIGPAPWGFVTKHVLWEGATKAYLADRLEAAMGAIQDEGVGEAGDYLEFVRILEAESDTSARSEILRLSDSLELETVADDLGTDGAVLADTVRSEIERAEAQLGRKRSAPTLVTVLLRGSFIPTVMMASGFFVQKVPFGKICLPGEAVDDPEVFAYTVRRGVCYQILYALTGEEACRWFLEAATAAVKPPRKQGGGRLGHVAPTGRIGARVPI